jgi:hypothetical protein
MRRFLSLFMMMLLALRGLAGDVMAMESPAAHNPVAMVASAAAMHLSHDMADSDSHAHHEHVEHNKHAAADAPQCSAADTSGCGSHDGSHCTTCGLCHSAMGQSSIAVFAGLAPVSSQAPRRADRFASIAPAAQIKPPISAV